MAQRPFPTPMSFVVSGIPPGRSTKGTRHGPENRRLRPKLGEALCSHEAPAWTRREDVENRILESLYYNKDKEKALSKALNSVQNESRRNLRALRPWQVRNAEPHLETQAYRNLAHDMHGMRVRQGVRENDRRNVRIVLGMLSPDDRRLADEFMALGSWRRVAASRRMAWSTFRYGVLAGFKARFKEAWGKVC